jgi:hypothetical protein
MVTSLLDHICCLGWCDNGGRCSRTKRIVLSSTRHIAHATLSGH